MTTTPRKRRPTGDVLVAHRREEILAAAACLFARHGYADTDTQLLADALHVGKGTLYRYFPSKEALFLAAVDRVMRELLQQIEERIEITSDPIDRIAAAVRAFLTFFAQRPEAVELLMQERAQFKDRKKPTFLEHREANIGRWHQLYRELIAAGRIRDMSVERIAGVFGDLLYGTIFTNYFSGQRKTPEEHARDILDVVFRGILSDSERKRWQG